jgi:hypothetical protein
VTTFQGPIHLRPLTPEELLKDAASIAQQIHDLWDGEVEVTIILTPKASLDPFVARATTIGRKERLRQVLDKLKYWDLTNLKGKLT